MAVVALAVTAAALAETAATKENGTPLGIAAILNAEPGSSPNRETLILAGKSETGVAAGRFALSADLTGGNNSLIVRSGGVTDEDGWDGRAWAAHGGAIEAVDLPGAVADARAESCCVPTDGGIGPLARG